MCDKIRLTNQKKIQLRLHYSGECYCGGYNSENDMDNTFNPLIAPNASGSCTTPCTSDASQVCGGGTEYITMYSFAQGDGKLQNPYFNASAAIACPMQSSCNSSDPAGIAPWSVTVGSHWGYTFKTGPQYMLNYNESSSSWAMDLASPKPYTIGQTVKTTIGLPYRVELMLSGGTALCGNVSRGIIRATEIPEYFFTVSSNVWTTITFNFTAVTDLTLLEIGSVSQAGCGLEVRCKSLMICPNVVII